MRHGQGRYLAPDGADLIGLTAIQTDTLVEDTTAHSVALYIVVVAVHHSAVLVVADFALSILSQLGTLSEELLLEVLENLLEGISTILLGQSLLGDIVCGLVQFFIHTCAEVLVVNLVVVLALHVLTELLAQLLLEFAHGLDGIHSGLEGTQQILLRHLFHLTFHHHDVLSRSTNHDVHVGLLHLLEGRIDYILAIDTSHAHLRDGALEGNIRASQGCRCSKTCQCIGLVNAVC